MLYQIIIVLIGSIGIIVAVFAAIKMEKLREQKCRYRKEEETREKELRKARRKLELGIGLLAVGILHYGYVSWVMGEGARLLEEKQYESALAAYGKIPEVNEEIKEKKAYARAGALLAQGEYERAKAAFLALGSEEGAKEAKAAEGEAKQAEGKYAEAEAIWEAMGEKEKALICRYRQAEKAKKEKAWGKALQLYESLGEYEDSEEKGKEIKKKIYELGETAYQAEEYEESAKYFRMIRGYKESEKYLVLSEGKDAKAIEGILGFENAKERLSKSEALEEYLEGKWEGKGKYLEEREGYLSSNIALGMEGELKAAWLEKGKVWIRYKEKGEEKETAAMEIEVTGKNRIRVTALFTNQTYSLKRVG